MTAIGAKAWEDIYAAGRMGVVWPWSDVISLVMRYARPNMEPARCRVIELGCGSGANIPFFAALGVDYHGIEASPTAIARLRQAFPQFSRNLQVGDFAASWPVAGTFDLVVDRAAITHNDMESIASTFAEIRRRLKPAGKLVCVDLFSAASSEANAGEPGSEEGTRVNFTDGPLAGTGLAHFFEEAELYSLLTGFDLMHLQHKAVTTIGPASRRDLSSWSLVARRT
jgi:SAM-dependent methyltransferase